MKNTLKYLELLNKNCSKLIPNLIQSKYWMANSGKLLYSATSLSVIRYPLYVDSEKTVTLRWARDSIVDTDLRKI